MIDLEGSKMNTIFCISTHGGAGYSSGDYWDSYDIICGACGTRITNPRPTGGRTVYKKGWRGLFDKGRQEPTWPEFIGGKRGVAWVKHD